LETKDRRIQRTYKLLKEALIQLLQEHEINDISIKMLCEKAKVTRQTFYLHFDNLQQFIGFVSERMLNSFRQDVHIFNKELQEDFLELTNHQSMIRIFEHVLCHRVFYEAFLVKNTLSPFARELNVEIRYFVTQGLAFVAPKDDQVLINRQLVIEYTTAGFFESIIWWIENNYEHSIEEMAKMMFDIATKGPYLANKNSP